MQDNWKPISEAPMDGTKILITDGDNPEVCFGVHYKNGHHSWQGTYYDGYDYEYSNGTPTHWQPLPLPPKESPNE